MLSIDVDQRLPGAALMGGREPELAAKAADLPSTMDAASHAHRRVSVLPGLVPTVGDTGLISPVMSGQARPEFVQSSSAGRCHQIVPANGFSVPDPFKTFAVRSEEPRHAAVARAPYGLVHRVRAAGLGPATLHSLAAEGRRRMSVNDFSDIAYAHVSLAELAAAAPRVSDLVGEIAAALQMTGVLGADATAYRHSVVARIDYLASCGAGFHNDVSGHWTGCLFWNLALAAADVEFVMPHAAVRLAVAPGDVIVFDPAMAHGLCRPCDQAQAVAASFETGDHCNQVFLSGELPLTDAQWAVCGSPWLPVALHQQRAALDLVAAEFDERSGAIKRVRSLLNCMSPSTCYVDTAKGPLDG